MRCTNCNKECVEWIAQIKFVKTKGLVSPGKNFVCSKECLKNLPKKFGVKFKITKLSEEVKK